MCILTFRFLMLLQHLYLLADHCNPLPPLRLTGVLDISVELGICLFAPEVSGANFQQKGPEILSDIMLF